MKLKVFRVWAAAAIFVWMPFQGQAAFADHHVAVVRAAVDHADRPQADRKRDELRKPYDILVFAGVEPGMTVLDINSAGGYYTEILSRTVGKGGKVYAHNGPVYWAFMKENIPPRFADRRLENVEHIHNGKETFNLPENSVDLAMAVLAYHDYYFTHEARVGGGHEDVAAVLASLYKAIRPGGRVVIIDHVAPEGTGPADFDKLHRIAPSTVRQQMEKAGFRFAGESDILLNPDDALTGSPFDPAIRGKTSRFVYRFTK